MTITTRIRKRLKDSSNGKPKGVSGGQYDTEKSESTTFPGGLGAQYLGGGNERSTEELTEQYREVRNADFAAEILRDEIPDIDSVILGRRIAKAHPELVAIRYSVYAGWSVDEHYSSDRVTVRVIDTQGNVIPLYGRHDTQKRYADVAQMCHEGVDDMTLRRLFVAPTRQSETYKFDAQQEMSTRDLNKHHDKVLEAENHAAELRAQEPDLDRILAAREMRDICPDVYSAMLKIDHNPDGGVIPRPVSVSGAENASSADQDELDGILIGSLDEISLCNEYLKMGHKDNNNGKWKKFELDIEELSSRHTS